MIKHKDLNSERTSRYSFEAIYKNERLTFKIFVYEDNTLQLSLPLIGFITKENENYLNEWNNSNWNNTEDSLLYDKQQGEISKFLLNIYKVINSKFTDKDKEKDYYKFVNDLKNDKIELNSVKKVKSITIDELVTLKCYYQI